MTGSWQELPCSAVDIGVGPEGGAWICGTTHAVFQWTVGGWSRVEGEARRVAVGPGDQPWIVGVDHRVRRRADGQWLEVSAPVLAVDVGVDPSGGAWMTGQDGALYGLVGDVFVRGAGAGVRVAAGADRLAVVVGDDGAVRRPGGAPLPALPAGVRAGDVGVGADGTVWCAGSDFVVRRLDAGAAAWVDGGVNGRGVAVGPGGEAWVVRRDGSVARELVVSALYTARDLVGEAYLQTVQCTAVDVAVGPADEAWIVATDRRIHQFTGGGWSMLDGLGLRIAVGQGGAPWVIGTDRRVFRRVGATWAPTIEVASGAEDIAVAPSGAVWIVAVDRGIHRWDGAGAPVRVDGAAYRVAVDREDRAWVVGLDRALYVRVADAWQRVAAPQDGAVDVAAGADGSVWVTAGDGRVYRMHDDRSGWRACEVQATSLAVAPHGGVWAVQRDTRIARHTVGRLAGPAADHVRALCWRYLGRGPNATELEWHLARLLGGAVDRDAQDLEFSAYHESVQHLWVPRHDLVIGLYWTYLGRHPTAEDVAHHIRMLTSKQHTEASLEAYFRTCPEAVAHGTSTTQELVLGLWWRHLGHGPWAEELSATVALPLTREQLVAKFRDCAEARDRRRPYARAFVTALCWRYLGRAPGEAELAHHAERLVVGELDRDALTKEFAGCQEATHYTDAQTNLTILAAAYTGAPAGKEDVTATVRGWVREHQILRGWTPAEFGAAPDAGAQALVIVYRYGQGPARTKIVPTGWSVELWPRVEDRTQGPELREDHGPAQLTILGAAYGRRDVTTTARTLAADGRLYADVDDATWGPGSVFPGVPSSLVVVYQVGDSAPVVHLSAPGKRAFVNAPPLTILGATFGQEDVTGTLANRVRGGTLEVRADAQLAGRDPWPGVTKTAAVVYRYGGATERARVLTVLEGQMLVVTPEVYPPGGTTAFVDAPDVRGELRTPLGLRILGAAWGLTDVTGRAIERVDRDMLDVPADARVWGPGGMNTPKTVTIVYQIDGGRPMLRVATEGAQFVICAPQILGATWGPLDVTDRVAGYVRGGVPGICADNRAFPDAHPGQDKFLTVCFRYGDGSPQVRVFREGEALSLPTTPARGSLPPGLGVQVLGASWGPRDVSVAARFADRDFVRAMFARYIGRAPLPTELDGHVRRLVADELPRELLEAEFAGCDEGRRRANYRERDFVQCLFARYIKRAPTPGELDGHSDALVRGATTYAALEEALRTCVEAQQAGPPTDANFAHSLYWRHYGRPPEPAALQATLSLGRTREQLDAEFRGSPEAFVRARLRDHDFVVSLYWEHLGRDPDINLDIHFRRLVGGERTRETLAEEFRTCAEARAYVQSRTLRADNASWTDSLPGRPKQLTVVYRVGDGEPRVAVASESEALVLPPPPRTSAAHLLARVETLPDPQVPPAQTLLVTAPGTVVAAGGAPATGGTPTPRPVHQVVLTPRRAGGDAAPAGTRVTIACAEAIDILTDQSGANTLYKLAANVPLELVLPTAGHCRLALPVKDGELTAPLLRARWDEMAPDVWAVVAVDQHLHARLAELRPADLLAPPPGMTSPLARGDLGRAHALRAGLAPAMRACQQTALHVRSADGRLRLAEAAALVDAAPADGSAFLPAHVVVPAQASVSRVLVCGATRHYRLRGQLRQRAEGTYQVMGLFDWVEDLVDDIGDAFEAGFDAVNSALTTAFQATVGGLESAFRWTVEGMQSLVAVAERYATTAFRVTKDALGAAQCVLLDATNGLVAFVVSVQNGVLSVVRTVIDTIEDVALLVADQVARAAMKVKEVVEFIIMMWLYNWTDILETQRYLADVVNAELDAFPQFATRMAEGADDLCDALRAAIAAPPRAPTARLEASRGLDLGPLGDAFEFIYDRLLGGLSALVPTGGGDDALDEQVDAMLLRVQAVELPATAMSRLVGETDPNAILDALRDDFAVPMIEALRGGLAVGLAAEKRAAELVKDMLNTRLYIPVLTELIEVFIFRGRSELTPLTLVTLLAGAGYNNVYKLVTGSRRGPFRGAPAYRSQLAGAGQEAFARAGMTSFGGYGSNEPHPALTGSLAALGGVCSGIAFLAERKIYFPKSCAKPMTFLSTLTAMVATGARIGQYGAWAVPQFASSVAHSLAARAAAKKKLRQQKYWGGAQIVLAALAGIGMLATQRPRPELNALRMSSDVLDGLADVFVESPKVSAAFSAGAVGTTVAQAIVSAATA